MLDTKSMSQVSDNVLDLITKSESSNIASIITRYKNLYLHYRILDPNIKNEPIKLKIGSLKDIAILNPNL